MLRTIFKSKLHNATVTQANLNYEGSITIDESLMKKADILEGERVQIVNLNNGNRLETYAIKGKPNSGIIGLNGPAALKGKVGDKTHIISYAILNEEEIKDFKSKTIFLDEKNKIKNEK